MTYKKKGASKIMKNHKAKKYKRRKYKDGTVVIYTSASGQICITTEVYSALILDALNATEDDKEKET